MEVDRVRKIAVLLPSMQVGGAERLVIEELAYLKDDPRFSFELHLVFEKGPFFDRIASLGVPVYVWNAPHKSIRMLKTYLDIIRYLRRTHCDILHNHLLDSIGPIVGKLAGLRVVATVHSDKRYGAVERLVLRMSDLVLGCGKRVSDNIGAFIPEQKLNLLNNALRNPNHTSFHRADVCSQFGIKEDSSLVVSLGRLTRQKGFDILIEAFRYVVEGVPNAILLIGGDGEERNRLTEVVESAGLEAHVKLPGLINDTNAVLASCDVYVNSSRREGLPMTLLEAMAHGKPIVATNVGSNPEVVEDGHTGLLVPPENSKKLADALIRILKDEPLRNRLGKAAAALFSREYTIDKHCESLAEYYLQVVRKNHRAIPKRRQST